MQASRSKHVLVEAVVLLGLGLLLALVANAVSPRGLSLTRNYFPAGPLPGAAGATNPSMATVSASATNSASTTGAVSSATPADTAGAAATVARLQAKGLRLLSGQETLALYQSPGYQQELIVFVDARDDRHYESGHIPGAHHFDRYYPDKYLPMVLPPCLNATQVVVYCTGGACEDSEFAALALREAGVAPERIAVFAGGLNEWITWSAPLELGGRNSGNLKPTENP